ncbi:hypothetical protein ACQ86N_03255 [Puia sp. P3]|uniref:hypothetical protein n=1 Tax=Puia sp. P3 TaxID=3423952 RepID=UPI003D676503
MNHQPNNHETTTIHFASGSLRSKHADAIFLLWRDTSGDEHFLFFLLPWLVGYLTILLIPYREGQTAKGAFFKPWLSCLTVFIVTYYLNIEGMVCWFMAFPVFLLIAGFGGVTAFHRKKRRAERNEEWDFDKKDQDRLSVSLLLFLPLFTGLLEGKRSSSYEHLAIRRQVELAATPEQVWTALMAPTRTAAKPHTPTICSTMGFPNHLSTTVSSPEIGGHRTASYEKGLVFFETITRLEPNKRLELDIHTDPSTISKAIMDDHIVIGGEHIHMEGDAYSPEPLPGGRTGANARKPVRHQHAIQLVYAPLGQLADVRRSAAGTCRPAVILC